MQHLVFLTKLLPSKWKRRKKILQNDQILSKPKKSSFHGYFLVHPAFLLRFLLLFMIIASKNHSENQSNQKQLANCIQMMKSDASPWMFQANNDIICLLDQVSHHPEFMALRNTEFSPSPHENFLNFFGYSNSSLKILSYQNSEEITKIPGSGAIQNPQLKLRKNRSRIAKHVIRLLWKEITKFDKKKYPNNNKGKKIRQCH